MSAHYVVDEDGTIYALVPEERRAWHAGVSSWRDCKDVNGASVGIEIVNPGHEFGYRPFPSAQIEAVISLVGDIRSRWDIPDRNIVGHSDVAPARKEDPGEYFPWQALAEAGHGLWPDAFGAIEPEREAAMGPPLGPGDAGPGVFVLQGGLNRLGYAVLPGGPYDAELTAVVTAFQRHWCPEEIGADLQGRASARMRVRLMTLLRHIQLTEG